MKSIKLAIGSDHAGFALKEKIRKYLEENGHRVKDFGCFSEERADYADYAHAVANAIEKKEAEFGIVLCGSGNGINMAANKHKGIRSALCWKREIAELARLHNDANILALPARYIDEEEAFKCLDVFLATPFEGGRHAGRVAKIDC
jgi:ribose 5-phosphate isomerase B